MVPGKGRRCTRATARGSVEPPRRVPASSRGHGVLTQGNRPQIAACAQTVPTFERGAQRKRCCTRFRATVSMQYPWVKKDPAGVPRQGRGYRPDRRVAEVPVGGSAKLELDQISPSTWAQPDQLMAVGHPELTDVRGSVGDHGCCLSTSPGPTRPGPVVGAPDMRVTPMQRQSRCPLGPVLGGSWSYGVAFGVRTSASDRADPTIHRMSSCTTAAAEP